MDWADLFDRAAGYEIDVETIRETLARHRAGDSGQDDNREESDA